MDFALLSSLFGEKEKNLWKLQNKETNTQDCCQIVTVCICVSSDSFIKYNENHRF